jgi:hypothetical protein
MISPNFESNGENQLMYEVVVELAGEVFVLQKSINLVNNKQISIAYRHQSESK